MSISSSFPCRAGTRPRALALAALTATGAALLAVPAAAASPGDQGDVVVRITQTQTVAQAGQPNACSFSLEASRFDVVPGITWTIEPQPAKPGGAQLSGHLALTGGAGKTDGNLALPEGHYKLTWRTDGGMGAGKQKLVTVECRNQARAAGPDAESDGPGAGPDSGPDAGPESEPDAGPDARDAVPNGGPDAGPNGGPSAGGGGLADPQEFAPVAGAAAVGLVAVGGVAYYRLRRRRLDGAA